MAPLICTNNTLGHVDYGIPLTLYKSTDYRTTTGTNHRFIPSVPQDYNCRVKAKVRPQLLKCDVAVRDEVLLTNYNKEYVPKLTPQVAAEKLFKANQNVQFIRNADEKITKDPPAALPLKLSEMKRAYKLHGRTLACRDVYPPSEFARCKIEGLGRDEQPPVRPEDSGFWKHLDIYLTENRANYVPYKEAQVADAQDDLNTFYSVIGKYKGLKADLPRPSGNKAIYDKVFIKYETFPKKLSSAPKRCPNRGMQSEYQGRYIPQTFSDFAPKIHYNGVTFDDSLSGAGPWQNICAPGMYCTEYCHIGSGWPVGSVIPLNFEKEYKEHKRCLNT